MKQTTKQNLRGLAEIVAILGISLGGALLCAKGLSYWDRNIMQKEQIAREQKDYTKISCDSNNSNHHLYMPTITYEK